MLRSSDQVNFRVHKGVLAMSSPFFKDLLSLPQPSDNQFIDGLPVVQVPENTDLLNTLVSLLYLVHPVMPLSYKKVFALFAACQKYDMVSMQSLIREEIRRGYFPEPDRTEALGAYGIASSMRLEPEMKHAARLTLGHPMTFDSLGEDLRSFKGLALRNLIRYCEENRHKGPPVTKSELISRLSIGKWPGLSGLGWGVTARVGVNEGKAMKTIIGKSPLSRPSTFCKPFRTDSNLGFFSVILLAIL